MRLFLKLRHWQLFALLPGIPFILQMITMITILTTQDFSIMIYILPVIVTYIALIYFGWMFAVGNNLYLLKEANIRFNIHYFRLLIMLGLVAAMIFSMSSMYAFQEFMSGDIGGWNLPLISLALNIILITSILGCVYFTAGAIKVVEMQKQIQFKDFMVEFLLLCFFPVGIWIIQPRINKIFKEL